MRLAKVSMHQRVKHESIEIADDDLDDLDGLAEQSTQRLKAKLDKMEMQLLKPAAFVKHSNPLACRISWQEMAQVYGE